VSVIGEWRDTSALPICESTRKSRARRPLTQRPTRKKLYDICLPDRLGRQFVGSFQLRRLLLRGGLDVEAQRAATGDWKEPWDYPLKVKKPQKKKASS
jgi:hypothetical protein